MAWSTKAVVLFISLPIMTFCAGLLYYLHKKNEIDEEVGIITAQSRVIEIKVPIDKVPAVIGRAGAIIKEIQEKTNTKINFREGDSDNKFKICRIRGTLDSVERAEICVNDIIHNHPDILTDEMWVPQSSCGRIIGRCGETIKTISSQSNAKVIIDRYVPGKGSGNKRQVIMKGTAQEIAVARSLIQAKVDEENHCRGVLGSRTPRTPLRHKAEDSPKLPEIEQLIAEASDSMIQVYVSAVASPYNFWVQLVNPRSVELDHLVDNMTDYYSQEENRTLHKLATVNKNQIVAAPFEKDNRWYRVQVCNVLEDKKSPGGRPLLDIFYVDYGDSSYIELDEVLELRTDFLSLRFQAIECQLAYVKPASESGTWEEGAVSQFEDMVYAAQWKCVMVKVIDIQQTSPPRPIVTIFDPEEGTDAGEELVKMGLAVRAEPGAQPGAEPGAERGAGAEPAAQPGAGAEPAVQSPLVPLQSITQSNPVD